jgi:hypothetical protein
VFAESVEVVWSIWLSPSIATSGRRRVREDLGDASSAS